MDTYSAVLKLDLRSICHKWFNEICGLWYEFLDELNTCPFL